MIRGGRMWTRLGLAFSLVAPLASCGTHAKRAVSDERTLYDHKIHVNDRLPARSLQCSDGRVREVGGVGDTALVTFSTMADCSKCQTHLAGIDALQAKGLLPMSFLVVSVDDADRAVVDRAYRKTFQRSTCFDVGGTYWTRPGIDHSPVTALVVGGVVRYLNDQPLLDTADIAVLREDLTRLGVPSRR